LLRRKRRREEEEGDFASFFQVWVGGEDDLVRGGGD
jgi:hypothetical protein